MIALIALIALIAPISRPRIGVEKARILLGAAATAVLAGHRCGASRSSRSPPSPEEMASVLQVISTIENTANNVSDLDRAVDVPVETKNVSEAAIGLAHSALVLRDQGLAAEVRHLEDRLDEMKDRLELWVLRAAADDLDPSPLRGLLHLPQETIIKTVAFRFGTV